MAASRYTVADDQLIPTGETVTVKGTPLDFTVPTPIGQRIDQLKMTPSGCDNNFVLNHEPGTLALCARLREPRSGRVMEVWTTQPGVQLYTAHHVRQFTGLGDGVYAKHPAVCLETQHYPDSVNLTNFPFTIVRPGKAFKSTTVFKISAS